MPIGPIIETDIPARLDRLPWGCFHTLVVIALGVTWILDGLEVTLAGSLAGALKDSSSLHFSNTDIGFASSAYLAGATLGAILFGALIDTGSRTSVFAGYLLGAVLMIFAGCVAWRWSVDAERKPLEAVARPLTYVDADGQGTPISRRKAIASSER